MSTKTVLSVWTAWPPAQGFFFRDLFRSYKIDNVLFFQNHHERMKPINPKKSVKWCARIRMYGETYEEKLLAPLRVDHLKSLPFTPSCGMKIFIFDCLG